MGDEDEVLLLKMLAQRGDQFGIKSFEMALCSLKERLLEALCVSGTHAKFRELEAE